MAIDTNARKLSVLDWGPFNEGLPFPAGSLDTGDQEHLLDEYAASSADAPVADDPPFITTIALGNGFVDTPYSRTLAVEGTAPITFAVIAGTLPNGLSLNVNTGAITGTPTTPGTSSGIEIEASNGAGDHSRIYSIKIRPAAAGRHLSGPGVSGGGVSD